VTEENGGPKPDRVGRRPRSVEMAKRDLRIIEMVAAGMRVTEIALRERLSKRRVRELIARNLADRERLRPPQFFELQTRRLSEALLVAYAKMNDGNLAAVDRVVTIVRELDRYHGFAPTEPARAALASSAASPLLALEAPSQFPAAAEILGAAEKTLVKA
jgi:DNA-binding CsgD family transcriptional regulator